MIKCSEDCIPCCDFCKLFNGFNQGDGVYRDDGYCLKHKKKTDPGSYCDDYVCMNVEVRYLRESE